MNKMRPSSVAPDLKLELKAGDGGRQQGSGAVNCLELRLGISSVDNNGSGSWQVDPWSLAARQEKARQRPEECDVQRENNRLAAAAAAAAASAVVGWPPVRAFRKNLSSAAKPADAADDALLSSKEKLGSEDGGGGERRPGMFVKVHLEGCAVGRKVDLQAHLGYGSLSRALRSMFLLPPGGQWRIPASADKDEDNEEQKVETTTTKKKTSYILLYEDNEGDRMLVGDVPWELFVASVKRLYIAQDTRTTR